MRYDTAHIDTGWDYHTLYQLATSFMIARGEVAEFEDYLEDVAAEELEDDD